VPDIGPISCLVFSLPLSLCRVAVLLRGIQADVVHFVANAFLRAAGRWATMVVGGAITLPQGVALAVLILAVVVPVADIARFTMAVRAALHALAVSGVVPSISNSNPKTAELPAQSIYTVRAIFGAVVIDLALHALAPLFIADTTVAIVIDIALNAPALAGVADTTVAVIIDVAHHAPAVILVADIIIPPRTSFVRGTGAEAEVVVAEAFGTDAATALVI